jgi:hypothetical protein
MQGSLNEPPIIIRQDRAKLGLMVLVAGVLTLILYGFLAAGMLQGDTLGQHAFVIAFALLTLFGVWKLLNPGSLIIGPAGLDWRTSLGGYHYEWTDFDGFAVFSGPYLRQASAKYSNRCTKYRVARMWNLGTLGSCWELSPAEVVSVLNAARQKWTPASRA